MAGKRHQGDRACRCDPPDVHCAGLTVRRLSSERVRELAEEIWAISTGTVVPARPVLDPRDSRASASARPPTDASVSRSASSGTKAGGGGLGATWRQLPEIVRDGSPLQPGDVERATARAIALLRPAV